MLNSGRKNPILGPGLIITAAFIGPGTVTTCTLAGSSYGYTLLWALVFAAVATFILQDMSGRLGLIGGSGLGEAVQTELPAGILRISGMFLVVCAIGIGNAAYQTGNLIGAALGLASISGLSISFWSPVIGVAAFLMLFFGSYKHLEWIFSGLVFLMSLCFVVTAFIIRPDIGSIISGMFVPKAGGESLYIALGLVGTTIVPYNLFLYASVIRQKWQSPDDLPLARKNLLVAVAIGGVISMSIVITASAAFFGSGAQINSAGDMAVQLEPLLGTWAKIFIAIGLFGAGMTSSVTAPLAAAFALSGIFGWKNDMKSKRFRSVWIIVLLTGIFFASIGLRPVPAIVFAQVANGIFLPVIAVFLLYVMNVKRLMGKHVNSWKSNIAGAIIILISFALGLKGIMKIF